MKFKFRIWDDERKEMCNNPQFDYNTEGYIDNVYHPDGRQIEKFEVMLFIELNDINGKEIYEKDIVKFGLWCNPKNSQYDMQTGIVEFKYGIFGIEYYSSWSEQEKFIPLSNFYYEKDFHYVPNIGEVYDRSNIPENDLEVIGNIYENPDKEIIL